MEASQIDDINLLARFLAHEEIRDLPSCSAIDAIVICASEVLYQAETLFAALEQNGTLAKAVVLCGGIGHSTALIHEAVARHPKFGCSLSEVSNLAEARVLEKILNRHYDTKPTSPECYRLLIENQSTNCGMNALYSKNVLDNAGFSHLRRIVIIQDPTMMKRTIASFEKAYESLDNPPQILGYPVFVPSLEPKKSEAVFSIPKVPSSQLWDLDRFLDLVMGELPRIRDDDAGYGPRGKGFITHVEVPEEIEAAWHRLKSTLDANR